jgi:hypothetical protein
MRDAGIRTTISSLTAIIGLDSVIALPSDPISGSIPAPLVRYERLLEIYKLPYYCIPYFLDSSRQERDPVLCDDVEWRWH